MEKMYEEGGLATDGMDVDPVSGNDIPVGSNATDVRDDVDAKLSSGEYVVPADVVKYLGVAQLEKLVDKAKMGLEDMAENGRIGGEPVDEPEEVVMTLGGDLDTLDGYATGGMVPGTDIDGIIERVKGAAMKDPSILNMLKAKGIFVDAGQPAQATPPAVEGQNDVPAAFAAGGLTGEYNANNFKSDFNPYAYTPGFSAETDVTGNAPTAGGLYGSSAPTVPSVPTTPTCPPGSAWDAVQNMCVPIAPSAPIGGGGGGNDFIPTPEGDPNAWMEKFDYSNPETLFENTMSTIGGGEDDDNVTLLDSVVGIAKGVFAGGIIGKVMSTTNAAQAAANAIVLRDMGRDDLADKIDAQYDTYVDKSGIKNVPTKWRDGDRYADSVKESKKEVLNSWGTTTKKPIVAKPVAKPVAKTKAPTGTPYTGGTSRKPIESNTAININNKAIEDKRNEQAGSVAQDEAKSGTVTTAGGKSTMGSDGNKTETYASKVQRGGGFATGGLVSKPKAKAKPTPAKKTTNKKGLGRK